MKKLYYLLFIVFICTSATVNRLAPQRLFEKTVEVEIDFGEDSTLFTPFSDAWSGIWAIAHPDLTASGVRLMNVEKYRLAFTNRMDNLYTVLFPAIIEGDLQVYSPYDPASYGLGKWDGSDLRYPVLPEADVFLASEALRDELIFYLGRLGPQSDLPMATQYGEDSTITLADGTMMYVYPPRDMLWYKDKDIVKYKLSIKVLVNKEGVEKKRFLQSIAPVVNETNESGEIVRQRPLFWLDYTELEPLLKEAYFFNTSGKPVTYLKYFQEKLKGLSL